MRRMIHTHSFTTNPALKVSCVFSKVMQQTNGFGHCLGLEHGCMQFSELTNTNQMFS